jgi:hypothetical protein
MDGNVSEGEEAVLGKPNPRRDLLQIAEGALMGGG